MLRNLMTGVPVMVLCLLIQAIFATIGSRRYIRSRHAGRAREHWLWDIEILSVVMLLMLMGTFVQTAAWAVLFMWLHEFPDFATALYFSAVNFSTLGYGDVVLSNRWRLLGPMEAANGILMFGVSTAVMTAAVADVVARSRGKPSPIGARPKEETVEA